MNISFIENNCNNELLTIFEKNKYLFEIGNIYEKINMYDKAIHDYYIEIIQTEPQNFIVLNQIGVCYYNISQYKLAIYYFNKVLKIIEIPHAYVNIGICYETIKDYSSAGLNFLKAYGIDSNNCRINFYLGKIYYILKDYDKSIKYYKKINDYKINPNVKYNTSFSYLAKKKFEKGFELYENRLMYNNINPDTKLLERLEIPSLNLWNGKDICNKLLIIYEEGLGDNIQYYRFIIELSELYPEMVIHYFCKQNVSHIFKSYDKIKIIDNIIIKNTNNENYFQNYDYNIYIMSLPSILKLKVIYPNKVNYINTNEITFNFWKEQFSSLKKYKVGFVYNGLSSCFIENEIPLINFEILTDLDIDLICIHRKKDIIKDISNIPDTFKEKIHLYEFDTETQLVDTIHILQNIDLLITIDTYIVHLAGILNIKTWLLLGYYSEWRWSTEDSTYWYNSVELVRMKEKKEFKNILENVKNKLIETLNEINNNNEKVISE